MKGENKNEEWKLSDRYKHNYLKAEGSLSPFKIEKPKFSELYEVYILY